MDEAGIGRGSIVRLILIIYSAKKGPLLGTEARWTVAPGVSPATRHCFLRMKPTWPRMTPGL
jgi:hypothetical protein